MVKIFCNGNYAEAIRLGASWYCARCHKQVKVVW
jgi:hypothetical protein